MSDSRKSSTSSASDASKPCNGTLRRSQDVEQQSLRPRIRRHSPVGRIGVTRYPLLPSLHPSTRRLRVEMCFPELDPSAPKTFKPITRQHTNEKLVFLAGGVSSIADWRAEVLWRLQICAAQKELPNAVLINPYFKAKALNMSDELTKWEVHHFARCDLIIFWFHKFSPCTISLLEFGQWAVPQARHPQGRYNVLVGADPEYERQRAVAAYCEGKHKVYDSLDLLAEAAADILRSE